MKFKYRGVEFGGRGDILVESFDPGAFELRANDTDRSQRDGTLPGRDFLGGATWAFDLATNRHSLGDAMATSARLEAAWKNPAVRSQAITTEPLSYYLDGRWRRVYGRPGKYAGPIGNVLALQGVGRMVADFRVHDPLFYSEDENSLRLNIVPATTGGLVGPLVSPLVSGASGAPRAGLVDNTGDAATPLTATFYGPVSNPWVRAAAGWEIGLVGSLAYDQSVTVDARAGTVTRNDGARVAGMLSRATRLSKAVLPAGQSELTFAGNDTTGTAYVTLRWRRASYSLGG